MKRYRQYIGVFLAVVTLLIAGCQNSDVLDTSEPEANQLQFSATLGAAQTATRAGESNNKVLQIASEFGVKPPHIVIHTYTGSPGSSLKHYFSDELGYFRSGNYWDVNSGNVRFLPQGGMNLYAYFATDFAEKGQLVGIDYDAPAAPTDYPKLTYTVAADDALHQLDLIAAKVENISKPDILIPFRHILSQINFGVKGIDRHQIMIKNIRIHNVYGKGTFDYQPWAWSVDNNTVHSYPYYFPDRIGQDGGLGDKHHTQGTDDDSKNTYIFGDGGMFGPGNGDTFFYAQTNPTQTSYKSVENSAEMIHNSLMLVPQEIKKNPNATVSFDFEITVNGRVIRSATNSVIRLDPYYDWKPNLRYLYLFDFSDPSEKIKFDVLLNPWENWDSDGANTGIKNGTIQQPTATTLNTIEDGETIYLLGLLERNLLWDWSNDSQYTFANLNTLTLDFSGVETRTYSVEIKVPPGFAITGNNPAQKGKLTITRQPKILLEPTSKQLNTRKSGDSFDLYGTLANDLTWNWSSVNFSSLSKNDSFTLNFTAVDFSSGKSITLQLPEGIIASAYTVSSSATSITITNNQVSAVAQPNESILAVVSDHNVVKINDGNVSSSHDTWNWGSYTFPNLDPQESFDLEFSGVTFDGKTISITLPPGFRASGGSGSNLNPYTVSDNGTVTIKNNKINYPTSAQINALSGGNILSLSGEALPSDAPLNWSSYTFPNLTPQTSFTFDVTNVNFALNIVLTLPPYFNVSGGSGVIGSNPYTFTQPTSVQVLDNRIPKPSLAQLNSILSGSVFTVSGGKSLPGEVWDWSTVPFTSLGGSGRSFTLGLQGIDFGGGSVDIRLNGCTATGAGVTNPSYGLYRVSQNTHITITDVRRSVTGGNPSLTDVTAGQRVVLTGTVSAPNQAWTWAQMPALAEGEWFEIDYSQTNADGGNVLYLPSGNATYYLTGDYVQSWGYLFYKHPGYTNGIVRFNKQYNFPTFGDSYPNTNSTLTLPAGTMYGPHSWHWGKWLAQGDGSYYRIDFNNIAFVGEITVTIPSGYVATATGTGCVINGTTLTISGKCIVTVTNP